MNNAVIADQPQRSAALDPARSFIIQAPAGSGKTELLTQRVLTLLARVDEPEEVVAITFTKKAAAEMRQRVFAAIVRAQDATPPPQPHAQTTWRLARAALARSQQLGWRLEDNPQRLRVNTIDALCAHIARQTPLASRMGGSAQIDDQAGPLYREAVRATLAVIDDQTSPFAPKVARVLRHFDNNIGTVEAQLIGMLQRRDQWQDLLHLSGGDAAVRARLAQLLGEFARAPWQALTDALSQTQRGTLVESATWAWRHLEGSPLHGVALNEWPCAQDGARALWQGIVDLLLTAGGTIRKTINKTSGFIADKGEAKIYKDQHLALLDALSADAQMPDLLLAVRNAPEMDYSDEQWQTLDALLHTLMLALAQLKVIFEASGKVDFAEVAARAVAALGEDLAPTELALKLDYRIRHILVDEFQDTSTPQWTLLEKLTSGWEAGDGRSLFVVGDPMQSIYRFRDANVGLFLRAWQHGIGDIALVPLQLQCNFRSQKGVVDWVNQAFAQVLPEADDVDRGAARYSPATAIKPAAIEPAVQVHALIEASDADEAAKVVAQVQQLEAEHPQASIAILVRGRSHLLHIVPQLRALGVRYRAVEIEDLSARAVISDLHALTCALLHPLDRVAWLAVLRAPWCALPLADLDALLRGWGEQRSVWQALNDAGQMAAMSAQARARVAPLCAVLTEAFASQGKQPLRRWVESVWLALAGPACARDASALDDAAAYLHALQEISETPLLEDPDQLALKLGALKASPDPEADGRVSLMTIHKSKGLEFDFVIVPGLHKKTGYSDSPPIVWERLAGADDTPRVLVVPVSARGEQTHPNYAFVKRLLAEKQTLEDGRLLYVAATRARQQLHLFGTVHLSQDGQIKAADSGSLLARLWPAVAADYQRARGGFVRAPETEPVAEATKNPAPRLRRRMDWQAPEPEPGLPAPDARAGEQGGALRFDWAGERARCVGVVYHQWMQWLADEPLDDWPAARAQTLARWLRSDLLGEGVPPEHLADAVARVIQGLHNTLSDARGRWLLDRRHHQAESELALIDAQDQGRARRKIIDRTFVDEHGVRWIVDFKTGHHQGGDAHAFVEQEKQRYRDQLEGYVRAMQALETRPIKAALYLPMLDDPALRWAPLAIAPV